jgi:uncharacterized membrane protein YdbT with pleckstrin-like domain
MSYIRRYLQPGESLVYETKVHWIVYGRAIFWAILTLVAAYFYFNPWKDELRYVFAGIAVFFFLIALLDWLRGFIRRLSTELAVTDRRIVVKTGIIRRRTYEMNRSKVESVYVDQGVMARVFGFGTIVIKGTGGGSEPLVGIDRPLEFRSYLTAG